MTISLTQISNANHHATTYGTVIHLFINNSSPPPPARDNSPQWARAYTISKLHDHTQRRTAVGRTPLDGRSTRRTDVYLTTHNTHNRQISMPLDGFETAIPTSERPQTARPVGSAYGSFADTRRYLSLNVRQ